MAEQTQSEVNKELKDKLAEQKYTSIIDDLNRTFWVTKKRKFSKKTPIETYFEWLKQFVKKAYKFNEVKVNESAIIKTKVKTEYIISTIVENEKIIVERTDEYENLYQSIYMVKKSFFLNKPIISIRELTKSKVIIYGYNGTKFKLETKQRTRQVMKDIKKFIDNKNTSVN